MNPDTLEIVRHGQAAIAASMRETRHLDKLLRVVCGQARAGAPFATVLAACLAFAHAQARRIHWGENIDARIALLEVQFNQPAGSMVRPLPHSVDRRARGLAAVAWREARRGPIPA